MNKVLSEHGLPVHLHIALAALPSNPDLSSCDRDHRTFEPEMEKPLQLTTNEKRGSKEYPGGHRQKAKAFQSHAFNHGINKVIQNFERKRKGIPLKGRKENLPDNRTFDWLVSSLR